MGRGYREHERFAMRSDNIKGRVPANRQKKKSNVERPSLQHLDLTDTSPETKRHYQLGMAEQVRQAVEKTNKRLYGKRAPLHFRDSLTLNEEEEKTAVGK
jgi:hypothetical protein